MKDKMKNMTRTIIKPNLSTYISFLLLVFAVISFISILFLKNNLIVSNKLEQEIIFNNIQRDTSNILTKVLYKYEKQKDLLKQKHAIVFDYINKQNKPLDIDLKKIYNKINYKNKKYNIYIINNNLIIRNTTFKRDNGFNLSFAKETFEKHKKDNTIGISAPMMESSAKKFFSYTDTYLATPNNKKILQVSYTYEGFDNLLKQLHENIDKNKKIKDLKAYLYVEDEKFIADFYFKQYKNLKPSLSELESRIKQGNKLSKLDLNITIQHIIKKDNKVFNELYIIQENPISSNTKIMYSLLFDQTEHENMLNIYQLLIYVVILIFVISLVITFFMRKIENKHIYDNLTKTYNRNGFESIYYIETKRCERYHHPFSMIMLDIDFFKKVNDIHGHLIGDEILISMCELINKSIRESDYLIRWGGEEFFILTPEVDLASSLKLAEKIRLLIEETVFNSVGHITISLSVAQKNNEESMESFLKRLDDLLYDSKKSGRNKISY